MLDRRQLLLGLCGSIPALHLSRSAFAQTADTPDEFLRVSRVITGSEMISDPVAQRIRGLLLQRIDDFDTRLGSVAKSLEETDGDRTAKLNALSDDEVSFALEIAKPWYLGYVGDPSSFVLDDDAAFATFLEVQSWRKILDEVPIPTLPPASAGWWDAPPKGVTAPSMPDAIKDWTVHPEGPKQIIAADPAWRNYATADHADIAAARRAKPDPGPDQATGGGKASSQP